MSIIDEIRAARTSRISEEHKSQLLGYIKKILTIREITP